MISDWSKFFDFIKKKNSEILYVKQTYNAISVINHEFISQLNVAHCDNLKTINISKCSVNII